MPMRCKICRLEDKGKRKAIDELLANASLTLAEIARRTGITKSALHRHRTKHLGISVKDAGAEAARSRESDEEDEEDDWVPSKLEGTLITLSEQDRDGGPANIVDGLFAIARAIDNLARVMESRKDSTPSGAEDDGA